MNSFCHLNLFTPIIAIKPLRRQGVTNVRQYAKKKNKIEGTVKELGLNRLDITTDITFKFLTGNKEVGGDFQKRELR